MKTIVHISDFVRYLNNVFLAFLPILGSDPKLCITFHYFSLVSFELQQFYSFSLIFLTLTLLKQRIQLFRRSLIQGYLMLLVIRFRLCINFFYRNKSQTILSQFEHIWRGIVLICSSIGMSVCMYLFIHIHSLSSMHLLLFPTFSSAFRIANPLYQISKPTNCS